MRALSLVFFFAALAVLNARCSSAPSRPNSDPRLRAAGEARLDHVAQLTHEGANGNPHWAFDGNTLLFEHRAAPDDCAQIYRIRTDGTELKRVSSDKGLAISPVFLPNDERFAFSSSATSSGSGNSGEKCSQELLVNTVKPDGADALPFEPGEPRAYNAETSICRDGSTILTSNREGDFELYSGKIDRFGTLAAPTRITRAPGYDGRATFAPHCDRIAWAATRKGQTEIWVANPDGQHAHQVTQLRATSTSPVFLPDGERILFASNLRDPSSPKKDLYLIRADGTHLERVTFSDSSEDSPAFSADGLRLAFTSSRDSGDLSKPQIFVADWREASAVASPDARETDSPDRFATALTKLTDRAGLAARESWLSSQLASNGLNPYFPGSSYQQRFEVAIERAPGKDKQVLAAHNIAGTWGKACGKVPAIVIGARMDALARDADDVSGVAALIEASRLVQGSEVAEARSCFVFVAFAGGQGGSEAAQDFVASLRPQKIRLKAMIDVSHAGRLENGKLDIRGEGTSREWRALFQPICEQEGLECGHLSETVDDARDYLPFYDARIPVLSVTTTTSAGGRGPLNATGGVQIARWVATTAARASSPRQPLQFSKSPEISVKMAEKPETRAYLGVIPDYTQPLTPPPAGETLETGIRVLGARPGSPAAEAGVQPGDYLVAIDLPSKNSSAAMARPLKSVEDLIGTLDGLSPEDRIGLHIRRSAQQITIPVQLGKRGSSK